MHRSLFHLKNTPKIKELNINIKSNILDNKSAFSLQLHSNLMCVCLCVRVLKDLLYKHNIHVGDRPPRTLYQGRDFQYFFSLPSGDPSDNYKGTRTRKAHTHANFYITHAWFILTEPMVFAPPVIISTEIRSSMYGTATKPCPVTVRVQPSFIRDADSSGLDPDLELWELPYHNRIMVLLQGFVCRHTPTP